MNMKEYRVEGLSCAECAVKIEDKINSLEGVEKVSLNFATLSLRLETEAQADSAALIRDAKAIVAEIEPQARIREKMDQKKRGEPLAPAALVKALRLLVAGLVFALTFIFRLPEEMNLPVLALTYLILGWDILYQALKNLIKGRVLDEYFLMSLATLVAAALGDLAEAVAVMLFYQLGSFFQDLAVARSRRSISALMDLRPDFARIKTGQGTKSVLPGSVNPGTVIVVRPGERVPLDGVLKAGRGSVDLSSLTGESNHKQVQVGQRLLSGSVNVNGLWEIEVDTPYSQSTVTKILELVENAAHNKAKTENLMTKLARYYTPGVVLAAVLLALLPPLFLAGAGFTDWLYRAMVFLVISCPCALVISIPLGFFGGLGAASSHGVLIKGGNYLDALNRLHTVVLDKTGTLTQGKFRVTEINPEERLTREELLTYAAWAEQPSLHPIAQAITRAAGPLTDPLPPRQFEEIPGMGVKAFAHDVWIIVGNRSLMLSNGIDLDAGEDTGAVVYVAKVAKAGVYLGSIRIEDSLKPDAIRAVQGLRDLGVLRVAMLSGDNQAVAERVGAALGVEEVYGGLLPHQKVEKLEEIKADNKDRKGVLFMGDGINDAPVLAAADIGVAMGGIGSDAAIEAADIVLMTDEPSKLIQGMLIAKRTRRIVWQNIFFAFSAKLLFLVLGALGLATMWEAVFADVGVALLAVINSMRVLISKETARSPSAHGSTA